MKLLPLKPSFASGTGHWMSPAFAPLGSFHVIEGGSSTPPELR